MTPRRVLHRLAALFRAARLDRELDDEIQAHLELAERDAAASGLAPDEARRAARLRFGPVETIRESHRDHRSARWIEHLVRDFRYGLASLARQPGFTAIAVGVLALGIGANAAMFSIVDAVLLKPIPFADPDRIVRVWEAPRPGVTNATSTLDFLDWQRMGTAFEALAAEHSIRAAWTGGGDPVRLAGKRVTADYFRVFTAAPRLGRTFAPHDDRPGATPVVVISHATWETHFGADPGVLQQSMVLDGIRHDIVGVLPPGAFDNDAAAFWTPLVFTPDEMRRDLHWLTVTGRLRAGVSLAQAREAMNALDAAMADVVPIWKRDWTIVVEQFDRLLVGDALRQSVLVAFGAVGVVLLIACANVTNLLLARGIARRKEIAVRAALGASRGRLVGQLLIEGLALCLLGAAAGLATAALLIAAASPALADFLPYGSRVALDLRVLAFTAVAALGVAMLIGALPSLTLSTDGLAQTLSRSGRSVAGTRGRVRRAIVVTEVALSVVLVCGAGLLFRSLFNLQGTDPGIRIERVITASVDLPERSYATPEAVAAFLARALTEIESVAGVERAGAASHLPLHWIGAGEGVFLPGIDEPVKVRLKRADAGYFDALDIPVLAGRSLTDRDRAGSLPVITINEALARRLGELSARPPVGQRVRLTLPEGELQDVEIVGVVRNEQVTAPGRPNPPVVYVPLAQAPSAGVSIVMHTRIEPGAVVAGIREAVRRVDPTLPVGEVATMEQVRGETLSFASRPAWVIGIFAAVAALLAALGIYGVIAHAVTEHRREICIRIALGARPLDVVLQVQRGALTLVAAGLAIGLGGAYVATGTLETLLFEVEPLDPAAIAVACGAMLAVGALAALLPARRAASLQPVAVLKEEG